MNNDLKINMKLISSNDINMKIDDTKPIDVNINGGVKEYDPIFTSSPAYTITYNDITKWNNKSNFSGDYNDLTNKPLIPTKTSELTNNSGFIDKNVNNLANYTLSTNISEVGLTGKYSDLIDAPTLPTKTSDLTNDSGYITNTVNDLTNYTLSSSLASVATTGSYSDLTNKPSLATVATTGFYSDLINKPTIPSQTSQLTNDSGFITISDIPTIPTKTSELTNDSGFITLSDIPTIPTATSQLTNDSGFITNTVNDLTNYTLSSSLSSVATSGSYTDLSNTPTIPIVDTAVSTSSTNAIENGAITTYVNNKVNDVTETALTKVGNYITTIVANHVYKHNKVVQVIFKGYVNTTIPSNTAFLSFPYRPCGGASNVEFIGVGGEYDISNGLIWSYINSDGIRCGGISAGKWVHMSFVYLTND